MVVVAKDTLALPSIDTLPVTEPVKVRVLEFAHFEDVEALPSKLAFIVAGNLRFVFELPSMLTGTAVPVPSLLTIPIFLLAPHLLVVISADPLKSVPLILRDVCKVAAFDAVPTRVPLKLVADISAGNVAF